MKHRESLHSTHMLQKNFCRDHTQHNIFPYKLLFIHFYYVELPQHVRPDLHEFSAEHFEGIHTLEHVLFLLLPGMHNILVKAGETLHASCSKV